VLKLTTASAVYELRGDSTSGLLHDSDTPSRGLLWFAARYNKAPAWPPPRSLSPPTWLPRWANTCYTDQL